MARQQATKGPCVYCGKEYTRGWMSRHLSSCPGRAAQIETTKGRGPKPKLYHLVVRDAYTGGYWLHLEMPGATSLETLDDYLRAIWLECCGHLSAFKVGNIHYTQLFEDDDWSSMFDYSPIENKSMNVRIDKVFYPGMSVAYDYDFGSTTELVIELADTRQGYWDGPPVALLSRNHAADLRCHECGVPAEYICVECEWDNQGTFFCQDHLESHGHGDEMGLKVVNSPRMGVCGYDGPGEPPY